MSRKHDFEAIKERAVDLSGGRAVLAEKLGITPNAVSMWKKIPPRRLGAVSAATGGRMAPEELRPDIFASA